MSLCVAIQDLQHQENWGMIILFTFIFRAATFGLFFRVVGKDVIVSFTANFSFDIVGQNQEGD